MNINILLAKVKKKLAIESIEDWEPKEASKKQLKILKELKSKGAKISWYHPTSAYITVSLEDSDFIKYDDALAFLKKNGVIINEAMSFDPNYIIGHIGEDRVRCDIDLNGSATNFQFNLSGSDSEEEDKEDNKEDKKEDFKSSIPYTVLGLPKDSDWGTIKKKYKTLMMKYHPDRGGDENKSKIINNAFRTLEKQYGIRGSSFKILSSINLRDLWS